MIDTTQSPATPWTRFWRRLRLIDDALHADPEEDLRARIDHLETEVATLRGGQPPV